MMDLYLKIDITLMVISTIAALVSMGVSEALNFPKWLNKYVHGSMLMFGVSVVMIIVLWLCAMWGVV